MVGASKILTVSYGTFSCTLEGFDDPFSTMRSIAEYFRDLAADDRYFGAEPPTPDADMLHRIAEREVQRRVESRVNDDGVVLRQVETHGATAAAAAAAGSAGLSAPAAAPLAEGSDEDASDDADPEGVSTDASTPTPEEDTHGEEVHESYAEDEAAAADADANAVSTGDVQAPEAGDDSVAAKLSRIRAVVARAPGTADAATAPTPFAGSIDMAFADAEDADFEDVVDGADHEDTLETPVPDLTEAGEDDGSSHDDVDDMAAMEDATEAESVSDLEALDQVADEETQDAASPDDAALSDEMAAQDTASDDSDADPHLGLAARIVKLKRAAAEMSSQPDEIDTTTEEPVMASDRDEGLSDEEEEDLSRELASVEQEDDANLFNGAFEDVPEGMQDAEVEEDASEAAVQADASMLAAIAEARETVLDGDEDSTDADEVDDVSEPDHRHAGFETEKTGEAALDRILEQTNSRMDDSEGSRRRSAIAHLKAAVAATKADRLLNRSTQPEADAAEEQSQYRNDLAQVVQSQPATAEPAADTMVDDHDADEVIAEKPTPLVLVSDQRVDGAEEDMSDAYDEDDLDDGDFSTPDASILPRRINSDGETVEVAPHDMDEEGFADFAEKMGVTELPDLLEAAAAYTAFVEGNKLFSRPQLMRRVATFEHGDQFTREAGLRSFGQLLRQGKIQKLKRGQFTITEETRFNPEARMAGE